MFHVSTIFNTIHKYIQMTLDGQQYSDLDLANAYRALKIQKIVQ